MAVPNVPEWLTADFLKSCLQSDENNFQNIAVTNHTIEPAVAAGNNYGSDMFRVKIQYKKLDDDAKEHTISLIIKAPTTDKPIEEIADMMKEMFKIEPKFYNEFINESYKLCKHDIVPKHYNSHHPLCIVMEDLRASGYLMADRHELLDFDHCRLYTKASAKLHALSIAVNKKNPELIESLSAEKLMQNEQNLKSFTGILSSSFKCMTAYLEDKPDYKEYFNIIKELSERSDIILKLFQEMFTPRKVLKALSQGDPWCTNMMFKYNSSGAVVGVKLIDFQNLKFSSVGTELSGFVWMSANPEVRKTKLKELYQLYCDSLNENLTELGCSERLSFEELIAEITFQSSFILMIVCTMIPMLLADEPVTMQDLFTVQVVNRSIKEHPMYKLYQGNAFKRYYPYIFKELDQEGVFKALKEKLKQIK